MLAYFEVAYCRGVGLSHWKYSQSHLRCRQAPESSKNLRIKLPRIALYGIEYGTRFEKDRNGD
jgi:hypothetical protein